MHLTILLVALLFSPLPAPGRVEPAPPGIAVAGHPQGLAPGARNAEPVVALPAASLASRTPIGPSGPGGSALAEPPAVVVIRRPGSYVLTGNLGAPSGMNGILIRSSDVTLDLSGHALLGSPGSLDAIVVGVQASNVRISNGTLRGWGQDGVDGTSLSAGRITDVLVEQCGGDGIRTGDSSFVSGCIVRDSGAAGIRAGNNSIVEGCLAQGCGGDGIVVQASSTIVECASTGNAGQGITGQLDVTVENCSALSNRLGIAVARGVIRGCTASFNELSGFSVNNAGSSLSACTARDNDGEGFFLGEGVTVLGCSAATNGGAGFLMGDECTVGDCTAFGNAGPGISAGSSCLVRSCVANDNTFGIVAAAESSVLDCVTKDNLANGIRVDRDSLVRGNCTSDNVGSGIIATGNENRIDSNHAADDDITLEASGPNTLVRNSADDYNLAPGATGFLATIRSTPTNAGPWDNIRF